jgi:cysteine desulfurase
LTPLATSVPNTAMVHFPGAVDGRNLVPALDLAGVQVLHGSACSSGATPPRILTALGLDEAAARACVRFSFGWREDLERLRRTGGRTGDVVRAVQKMLSRGAAAGARRSGCPA